MTSHTANKWKGPDSVAPKPQEPAPSKGGSFVSLPHAYPQILLCHLSNTSSGGPGHATPNWLGMQQLCQPQKDPSANQKHW